MASSNTNLGVVLGASTAVSGWPSSQSHELKKLLSHRTHAAPFSALLQCLDVRLSSPWAGQGSQVVEGQHAEWEKEEPKWVAYLAMGYVTGSGRREWGGEADQVVDASFVGQIVGCVSWAEA